MASDVNELDGRVVLVSGAARGQGRAIAERLLAAGASVIAGDLLDEVHSLADHSDRVHSAHLDVTDEASWASLLDHGISRFGHLDGLVNNAGSFARHRSSVNASTASRRCGG